MATAIEAKRAEVARRYQRAKRPVGMLALRVAELGRLRRGRYPDGIPDTPDGRVLVRVIVHHLAAIPGDQRRRLTGWLEEHAPWLTIAEARELTTEAALKPRRWRADRLAWRLKLNSLDRAALRITTIGAIDLDTKARAERRRQRDIARKAALRRANGAKPRAEYVAAVASLKPWIAAGLSRATWYRRRASETVRQGPATA